MWGVLLIEYVLFVYAFHDVSPDDGVEVGLHEIEHQVDVLIVLCLEDVQQGDDVGVPVELLQKNDLDLEK